MIGSVKKAILGGISSLGYRITREDEFDRILGRSYKSDEYLCEIAKLKVELAIFCDKNHDYVGIRGESPSQFGQDLFALETNGWKRDGWFVEFGATNGKTLSNTWLLEKHFGWTGILAEPARCWHSQLFDSGRRAAIETDCVWSRTGEALTFRETAYEEFSTIENFRNSDDHDRSDARTYQVRTISLTDMLTKHDAPPMIDFLSIDTEGSEFEILSHHDFGRYKFRVICCEHNFTPSREDIHALLTSHGYARRFEELSGCDDWYVLDA